MKDINTKFAKGKFLMENHELSPVKARDKDAIESNISVSVRIKPLKPNESMA